MRIFRQCFFVCCFHFAKSFSSLLLFLSSQFFCFVHTLVWILFVVVLLSFLDFLFHWYRFSLIYWPNFTFMPWNILSTTCAFAKLKQLNKLRRIYFWMQSITLNCLIWISINHYWIMKNPEHLPKRITHQFCVIFTFWYNCTIFLWIC